MFIRTSLAVLATALTISASTASWAGDASASLPVSSPAAAPLAPGGAAGVQTAQQTDTGNTLVIVGGLAVVGVGVGLLVSNNGGGNHPPGTTTTTTSTSTTGTN